MRSISEPLRCVPEVHVIEWIDAQPLETLCLSAITVAELRAVVAMLPAGYRGVRCPVLPLAIARFHDSIDIIIMTS